ncbi:hypothetical protein TKK_0018239 [Trichogramma kaykai]|uniref:DDE Tnp4 domain-containing protein n=1 Tax=Trichogramma kaykai TaxID=54128 RepID=A0ABD2VYY4_9HYME
MSGLRRLRLLKAFVPLKRDIRDLLDAYQFEKSKRWINRRWLIRPYYKLRSSRGLFKSSFEDLRNDSDLFFKATRMDTETFDLLLSKVAPIIKPLRKRKNNVSSAKRLYITLRYLATGNDITSFSLAHRISETAILYIIKNTFIAIHEALADIYLRQPSRPTWRNVAEGFKTFWNIPNCIGSIDGMHVPIVAPNNSGSLYFNYKKFNSIVLLAICNHRYEFTCVDIGACGSESDGGVFIRSNIGKALTEGTLNIPPECKKFPGSNEKSPHYFVGDAAFGISKNMMRPYPGRNLEYKEKVFNYRLSRARRCIENAFGILQARWKVLASKPIAFKPEDVEKIIIATVCLHNFLMSRSQKSVRQMYCPESFVDTTNTDGNVMEGHWRNEVDIDACMTHRSTLNTSRNIRTKEAYAMRESLKESFHSPEGELPWQREIVTRGAYGDII